MPTLLPYEPIQMLWIGGELSRIEHLCMQSFIMNGHPVHLYTYGPVNNVPEKVTHLDANNIIANDKIFLHKGSYACFADLFRWKLLAEKGGYYCDTDMLCIQPFQFAEDVVIGYESYQRVNIAALKFPPGHQLCQEMLKSAENPLKMQPYDTQRLIKRKWLSRIGYKKNAIGWGDTAGPPAMSRAIQHFSMADSLSIKNHTCFYPVAAGNWDALLDPQLGEHPIFKNTYAVHLWNEMLRRNNIDKNAPFPTGSFLDHYFQKYCPNYD